jgi:hypothetical protein
MIFFSTSVLGLRIQYLHDGAFKSLLLNKGLQLHFVKYVCLLNYIFLSLKPQVFIITRGIYLFMGQ